MARNAKLLRPGWANWALVLVIASAVLTVVATIKDIF